jgi:hypothetical protein
MAVNRAVSSLDGQTDLRSSDAVSRKNPIGPILPTARGEIGAGRLADVLATASYLTSRCIWWLRQRPQYLRNSILVVLLRRFFMVE